MNAAAIADRVRGEGLLADSRPVVVLLSGGRDSTCLLDLAVRILAGKRKQCPHQLRQCLRRTRDDRLDVRAADGQLGLPDRAVEGGRQHRQQHDDDRDDDEKLDQGKGAGAGHGFII